MEKQITPKQDLGGMETTELLKVLEDSMGIVRSITEELQIRLGEEAKPSVAVKKREAAALSQAQDDDVQLDEKVQNYAKRHGIGYSEALDRVLQLEQEV